MISKNNTPVNEFSRELWEQIEDQLQAALRDRPDQRIKVAAFDADGTLWDDDAGETFFRWQIANCGLAGLPADPWDHYHQMKKVDPTAAYVWLAQISAGQSLQQMREWAAACFRERPDWPVFESQRRLIERLRELDFEIYIVTASIKWAVEPVGQLLGVDHDHVLGITTALENGRIGRQAVHPITWRQGKADGLLAATGGRPPVLAAGNTFGDIALLETATHVRLALSTQVEPGGLYHEEQHLSAEALRRGWLQHRFRGS